MSNFEKKKIKLNQALKRLFEVLEQENNNNFMRDCLIQRFEFTT